MTAEIRLPQLLNELSNRTLDAQGASKLDEMLASDRTARETYIDWMVTEAALNRLCAGSVAASTRSKNISLPGASAGTHRRWRGAAMAIAASLVGVALASSFITQHWIANNASSSRELVATTPGEVPVARITATLNCRWAQPVRGSGYGTELHAGDQLVLDAGLAEVTFNSGVKVVLEGPATLDLRDATEVELMDGRLAASIPASAAQPLLRVKRFVAFEPGSEFGLLATADGGSEVHVFGGRVSAKLVNDLGETLQTMRLAKFEGARVAPAAHTMTRLAADDDGFVRSMNPTSGPHDGLYVQESFDYLDGPLALHNGGFGWAGPWEEIEAAPTEGNSHATNRIAAASLEVEGMVPSGGRAIQIAHRNRVRRALSASIGGVFDAAGLVENRDGHRLIGRNGRTVYVGFLQQVSETGDGFYGFELNRGDGNGNRVLCIGNGAEGAGYGVTSNYNGYGEDNYPSLGEENTKANLFVVRIDYGDDDRDLVTVYRNPRSLVSEDACVTTAKLAGNFAFDRISLGNFDGTKTHAVDEIRVGTDFRAVVGQRDFFRSDLSRRFAVSDVLEASGKNRNYSYLLMPMACAASPK